MKIKLIALAGLTIASLSATDVRAQSFAQCIGEPAVGFSGTIVDAAIATPELSTLVDAVVAAGLVDALATTPNLTVFAPTNDAFAAIPASILGEIVADPLVLTEVLTYHVLAFQDDPRKYIQPRRVEALNGQSLYLSRFDEAPRVNEAAVSCTRINTDNGSVFLIDSVLTPQF